MNVFSWIFVGICNFERFTRCNKNFLRKIIFKGIIGFGFGCASSAYKTEKPTSNELLYYRPYSNNQRYDLKRIAIAILLAVETCLSMGKHFPSYYLWTIAFVKFCALFQSWRHAVLVQNAVCAYPALVFHPLNR